MKQFDYGDRQHDRYGRVSHLGTFNANPSRLHRASPVCAWSPTDRPELRPTGMADLLRRGMEEILEGERAAGYVYGDSSVFHVYLEAYPAPARRAGRACRRLTPTLKGSRSGRPASSATSYPKATS